MAFPFFDILDFWILISYPGRLHIGNIGATKHAHGAHAHRHHHIHCNACELLHGASPFFRHLNSMGVFYHTQPVLSIGFSSFLHCDLFFVENMQYDIAYDAKNVRFDHMILSPR